MHLYNKTEAFRAIIDAVVICDVKGKIIDFNPAAEVMFQRDKEEVLGKSIKILMPPRYSSSHDTYMSNYFSTGTKKLIGITRQLQGIRKDGTVFPLEISLGEVTQATDKGSLELNSFIAVIRDTSNRRLKKRKRTEEEEETNETNKQKTKKKKEGSKSSCIFVRAKVYLGDEVKMISLDPLIDVRTFLQKLGDIFGRPVKSPRFKDIDGDIIDIREENDLSWALAQVKKNETIKVLVSEDRRSVENRRLLGTSSSWEIPSSEISLGERLGKGYFGEVRKALWRGSQVACKIIYRDSFNKESDIQIFIKEVKILSKLRHPRVILFLGACIDSSDKYIVTEYMSKGSLYENLVPKENTTRGTFEDEICMKIARDVAEGMAYLHGIPILHRDLTSSNILLDSKLHAKVADFGLSRAKGDITTHSETMGAAPWTAPEVIKGSKFCEYCDVYSFGIVLWELLTGRSPCPDNMSPLLYVSQVLEKNYRPPIPRPVPQVLGDLIEKCWSSELPSRPSFEIIVKLLEKPKDTGEENSEKEGFGEEDDVTKKHLTSYISPSMANNQFN